MYLIVIADTKWGISNTQYDPLIMEIVMQSLMIPSINVLIIKQQPSKALHDFCGGWEQVMIQNEKEAKAQIKKDTKGVVVHFGTSYHWLKSLPQLLIPQVLPNEIKGISIFKRFIYNRGFYKNLQLANKVISFNDWSDAVILAHYPTVHTSLVKAYLPMSDAIHFEWSEMATAKQTLTQGDNFFLVFAHPDNVTAILKEFSIFKKWQQSTMHLVFVLDNVSSVQKVSNLLRGYKFKQDVVLCLREQLTEMILAASYLTVFDAATFSESSLLYLSIQHDVPLLLSESIQLPTTWKGAGEVLALTHNHTLSNHFKLYYKDEVYRQTRAGQSREWLQKLTEQRASFELFNNIVLLPFK